VNHSLLVVVIASGIAYGTPLLFAALGELLAQRGLGTLEPRGACPTFDAWANTVGPAC